MCGLCLPHCPTYVKTKNEADSPRGRVSLIQAFNLKQLPASKTLVGHLEGCLTCRNCEAVCPANVPYGELIDTVRGVLDTKHHWYSRLLYIGIDLFISFRWIRRFLGRLLLLYQSIGLQKLIRKSGILGFLGLKRLESFASPMASSDRLITKNSFSDDGKAVALFTGCFAEIFDRDTLAASQRLLKHLGFKVSIPAKQSCCGALYGKPDRAKRYMARNLAVFQNPRLAHILSSSTGCGAQLFEYPNHLAGDEALSFSQRHADINTFLAKQNLLENQSLAPYNAKVVVHTPCSLRHVLKEPSFPIELLEKIPGITLMELEDSTQCCGAAGSYMLSHPTMADALLHDKLQKLRELNPKVLVTSNIGCRLHFQAGMNREGLDIEVIHPVTLLDRVIIR